MLGAAAGMFLQPGTAWSTNRLFGVTPTDVPTLTGVALLLSVVGALASCAPASRAASTDAGKALGPE